MQTIKKNNCLTPYRLISKKRFEIMGVTILWVVHYHSSVAINVQPFSFIKDIGFGGADVFLFLAKLFDKTARYAYWVNHIFWPFGKALLEELLTTDYILFWTGYYVDYGMASAFFAVVAILVGHLYHFVIEKIKTGVVSAVKMRKLA